MKKVVYTILRIIVIFYAIDGFILCFAGVVLRFTEKNLSFYVMAIVGLLIFILFVFLDSKLKRKLKDMKAEQNAVSSLSSNKNASQIIESKKEIETAHNENSINPKFHRSAKERDLSFNFSLNSKNIDTASRYIAAFEKLHDEALKEDDFDTKISLLNQALEAFEKAKNFCYRTKGGMIWFQDMYEYMHNSQNECFSYVDIIQDGITYYTEIKNLSTQILDVITTNNGYMQKDLYKLFPDSPQRNVRSAVSYLEENNSITKTKQGNSYYLELVSTES